MWRTNIKFLAVFSLILAFPLIVGAQQVAFNIDDEASIRTSMDLEGGYVHDLEVDSNGRVYVGLYSPNGIFYSDDNTSWIGPAEGSDHLRRRKLFRIGSGGRAVRASGGA